MLVMMGVVVSFFRPADFSPGLFQEFVRNGHIRRGLIQKRCQALRSFRPHRCGPLSELGPMAAIMFNPVRQKNPQLLDRRFRIHVRPFCPF